MTVSVWRFLFEKLGRDLAASFPMRDMAAFESDDVRLARSRGVFRELPLTSVPCNVPSCRDACGLMVGPAENGSVRLACPRGFVNDRVVNSADVAAAEVVPERLLQQLARGNDIDFVFDRDRRACQVITFGRIPWLDGTTVCLAVGLGRHDATGALAAAAVLGREPFLVLLPPRVEAVRFDAERLGSLGIRVIPMDDLMDWRNLELRRTQLHVVNMANEVREAAAPYGAAELVLDAGRCQAFFRGQELRLTRLQFGFLLALSKSPGKVVKSDDIAEIAYAFQDEHKRSSKRAVGGVGQLAKLKREVALAFEKVDLTGHAPLGNYISSKAGVGYRLTIEQVVITSSDAYEIIPST